MATLVYTAAIQTRIYTLLGVKLANADTFTKTLIDGAWTSGSLSGGVALDALTQIQQIGQYFWLGTPATVPSEWEGWLVARAAKAAAHQIHPDRTEQIDQLQDQAALSALDAYNRNAITYDPGSTPEAATLTVQNMRYYVVTGCVRRPSRWDTVDGVKRQRPRQWPDFVQVDSCIHETIVDLWNRGDWPFKRRKVQLAIASDSTVTTPALSGETFHSVATRNFFYDDSTAINPFKLEWADGTKMAQLRARRISDSVTGRPQYFRFEDKSGTRTWDFYPAPDTAYTAQGEVYVTGPTLTTLTATTTAMARFPVEFHPTIKNRAYGKVLRLMGDPLGKELIEETEGQIEELLPRYCDVGKQDDQQATRDVYQDMTQFQNWDGVMGGQL